MSKSLRARTVVALLIATLSIAVGIWVISGPRGGVVWRLAYGIVVIVALLDIYLWRSRKKRIWDRASAWIGQFMHEISRRR